jgi:hypothetical protein
MNAGAQGWLYDLKLDLFFRRNPGLPDAVFQGQYAPPYPILILVVFNSRISSATSFWRDRAFSIVAKLSAESATLKIALCHSTSVTSSFVSVTENGPFELPQGFLSFPILSKSWLSGFFWILVRVARQELTVQDLGVSVALFRKI